MQNFFWDEYRYNITLEVSKVLNTRKMIFQSCWKIFGNLRPETYNRKSIFVGGVRGYYILLYVTET